MACSFDILPGIHATQSVLEMPHVVQGEQIEQGPSFASEHLQSVPGKKVSHAFHV